jgi:hypothetical protein
MQQRNILRKYGCTQPKKEKNKLTTKDPARQHLNFTLKIVSRSKNNILNKIIGRHNQLKLYLKFLS